MQKRSRNADDFIESSNGVETPASSSSAELRPRELFKSELRKHCDQRRMMSVNKADHDHMTMTSCSKEKRSAFCTTLKANMNEASAIRSHILRMRTGDPTSSSASSWSGTESGIGTGTGTRKAKYFNLSTEARDTLCRALTRLAELRRKCLLRSSVIAFHKWFVIAFPGHVSADSLRHIVRYRRLSIVCSRGRTALALLERRWMRTQVMRAWLVLKYSAQLVHHCAAHRDGDDDDNDDHHHDGHAVAAAARSMRCSGSALSRACHEAFTRLRSLITCITRLLRQRIKMAFRVWATATGLIAIAETALLSLAMTSWRHYRQCLAIQRIISVQDARVDCRALTLFRWQLITFEPLRRLVSRHLHHHIHHHDHDHESVNVMLWMRTRLMSFCECSRRAEERHQLAQHDGMARAFSIWMTCTQSHSMMMRCRAECAIMMQRSEKQLSAVQKGMHLIASRLCSRSAVAIAVTMRLLWMVIAHCIIVMEEEDNDNDDDDDDNRISHHGHDHCRQRQRSIVMLTQLIQKCIMLRSELMPMVMSAQALELMQRAQHVIHHAETHLHRLQRVRAIDAQAISLHRQCARRTLMVWRRAAHAQAELRRAMTRRHHHAAVVMWRLWSRGHRKQCLHHYFTQWLCFTFTNMSLSSCSATMRHDNDDEDAVRRRSLSHVRSVMTKRMQAKQTLSRVIWRRIMMEHDVLQRLYVRCFMTWKLSIHFQTLVDENQYLHDELRIKNMMMDGLCQTLRCLPDHHHHHHSDVHSDDDGAQAADHGKSKSKKKHKKNSQSASGT